MPENTYELLHIEWHTDDDGDRVVGTRDALEARAASLNTEWPAERWLAVRQPERDETRPDAIPVLAVSEDVHRMWVMLGAIKAWCSRNGHTYAEKLAMHGLGETVSPPEAE